MADDLLAAAGRASAAEQVLMPSGLEYRIEEVPILEAVRSGVLSGNLRALALQMADPTGEKGAPLSAEAQAGWMQIQRTMICRWVREVRWTCKCGECADRRKRAKLHAFEWQPWTFTPEDLGEEPPPISRVDLVALQDMVSYLRSPLQVDALSRVAHGLMDSDTAWKIVEDEKVRTIAGWASFRGQRGGGEPRPDGEDMGPATKPLAPRPTAGRGARARRCARAQAPKRRSA